MKKVLENLIGLVKYNAFVFALTVKVVIFNIFIVLMLMGFGLMLMSIDGRMLQAQGIYLGEGEGSSLRLLHLFGTFFVLTIINYSVTGFLVVYLRTMRAMPPLSTFLAKKFPKIYDR